MKRFLGASEHDTTLNFPVKHSLQFREGVTGRKAGKGEGVRNGNTHFRRGESHLKKKIFETGLAEIVHCCEEEDAYFSATQMTLGEGQCFKLQAKRTQENA